MSAGQNSRPVGRQFRDRLSFDAAGGALYDDDRRYVMLRADVLMGLFRALPEAQRAIALEALAQSVAVNGSGSARAYQDMRKDQPGADGDHLLGVIADTAPQLGWGRWQFGSDNGALTLVVGNSPFAAGYGPSDVPVCHAVKGMLQTVASMVLHAPVQVREVSCAATGAAACRFEAVRQR